MSNSTWAGVTVARILRARGRRGEVAAEILTDFPGRLLALRRAYLWDGKVAQPVSIRSCWLSQSRADQAIFHFEGSDSISEAQKLVGLEVQVPLAERMPLPPGCYYITDLIGCAVCEPGGSEPLGRVRDVQLVGEKALATPLLVVETAAGELLVPLAEEICRVVNLGARRIEVILPEGLRELNRQG